ncbi:phosphodiesterase [Celerinatantimonas diazotrophica]|uniref:3',5'-cyclic AMP phosphodiesterase CpdA n=1 Tax=Celerinatantimonas diazotrophica TaxID=412034 RepID=A0A4V2PNC1_9GAMM|nr:phosphodiesterase [Celerinatantimonas diazotrophica]TCK46448.1 3',5'-cyclic AMP phosphodiesterase CpdA [Celerinatantimonas diazotrophica]CAG9295175.1 3',5'-cyclic adenosine monophosphate phosphodiesterase CpdA [Celerinatantimonas diazotrophica]
MRIAQLSDMHFVALGERLYDSVDVNACNADIIHQLNHLIDPLDAIVVSGDITNDGTAEQYQAAAKILGYARYPLYLINGNHDKTESFIEYLAPLCAPLESAAQVRYQVDMGKRQLLFIDSTVPGQTYGQLSQSTLDWVAEQLAQTRLPVAIFMHHPPLALNSAHMDPINCRNGTKLLDFAEEFPHLEGIYCGHNHCYTTTVYRNVVVMSAPATSIQIPVYQHDATPYYQFDQPSCLLHSLSGDNRWVSYQHHFQLFQGVRRFPWVNGTGGK